MFLSQIFDNIGNYKGVHVPMGFSTMKTLGSAANSTLVTMAPHLRCLVPARWSLTLPSGAASGLTRYKILEG